MVSGKSDMIDSKGTDRLDRMQIVVQTFKLLRFQ